MINRGRQWQYEINVGMLCLNIHNFTLFSSELWNNWIDEPKRQAINQFMTYFYGILWIINPHKANANAYTDILTISIWLFKALPLDYRENHGVDGFLSLSDGINNTIIVTMNKNDNTLRVMRCYYG